MGQGFMLHHGGCGCGLGAVFFHELHAGGGVEKQVCGRKRQCLPDSRIPRPRTVERCASSRSRAPASAPRRREVISMRDTAAMAASASPRKPRVPMQDRSSCVRSLEVAWRKKAVFSSSGAMPQPLSLTRIRLIPPPRSSHGHGAGAGVDGVFQQFLDDTGRPLDHFAGGDHIRQMGGSCWIRGINQHSFAAPPPGRGGFWMPSARAGGSSPLSGGRGCTPLLFFSLLEKKRSAVHGGGEKEGLGAGVFEPCFSFGLQLGEICISLVQERHLSSIQRPRSALAGGETGCAKMQASASGGK